MDPITVRLSLLLLCTTSAVTDKVKVRTGAGGTSYDAVLETRVTGVNDHSHVAKIYRLTGNLSNVSSTKHAIKTEFEASETVETIPEAKDWDSQSVTIKSYNIVNLRVKNKDLLVDMFKAGYVEVKLNYTEERVNDSKASKRKADSVMEKPPAPNDVSLSASLHLRQQISDGDD